ncbi:1-acyl-sn-glycerol-3-phosphate acyltransferase [Gelidibacter salicanalis]|uniref:1-acyl-sn-glycerol-3-phosphate acyltransferase n=1 Tax=Gelidibacter salicanalis TaxID=291193 RepID=A0A934L099_9FLAO|nr:1-acyl-sn-glycerol-3-phosphate acyltransferase [Gelidibacter salicanalis]MBJ7883075.1 1-acyl-sn-glycerol-3-phosphate acyltransferase [Gelidibacter salicanalis]
MRWLSKFIYSKILGWKVVGNVTMSKDTIKKAVIIAAPHTSWEDFYIALLMRQVIGVKSNFVAKKELFKWPFNYYFRAIGGAPLDRRPGQNKVEAIAKLFENRDEFRLALSPEGTRKRVEEWKTGFYYIAKKADVPIIMFTFDFGNKQNKISEPFYPTDDLEADFKYMRSFFEGVRGKVHSYS